jgi:tRNA A37 threonylcarbamoyladenosine dehydratase
MTLIDERFQGFQSLIGEQAFARVRASSVCVVGLGGVGSWTVEALARSGVGSITLVDLDEVCITNVNRQLHALTNTVGLAKVEVLAQRIALINPACRVVACKKFFSASTAHEILACRYDVVVDTIDSVDNKTELAVHCVERDQPMITVGSGGNRTNALAVQVVDLANTIHDPLLQIVRKRLRQQHAFPRGERARFGIPCVYAPLQRGPRSSSANGCGVSERQTRKSCNEGLGSAVFVTGTIGFAAAGEVIRELSQRAELPSAPYPWKEKRAARLAVS